MCGRFSQLAPAEALAEHFQLPDRPLLEPRYNVAPTQAVAAVRAGPAGRELVRLRWGLVPPWSAGPKAGPPLINARAETVAEKPPFRSALRRRRCIIPASGYYEWQARQGGKQPFYFHPPGVPFFPLAGLWERWQGPGGEVIESCAVLTTAASEAARAVHDRMPVILRPEDFGAWLDPGPQGPELLLPLLRPSGGLAFFPVSGYVNSPRNEGPRCVEPAA
jgi:putative SOS response-associated peptidase YedK